MSLQFLDLNVVSRAAAELLTAVQENPHGPPPVEEGPDAQAWHHRLDQIRAAADRLKRALGAARRLSPSPVRPDPDPPSWPLFRSGFEDVDHSRGVRQGLKRLAYAAVDLSGYAADVTTPAEWRTRGVRLLTEGAAQVAAGLTPPGAGPTPGFDGPEYYPADEYRCIDRSGGYVTRDGRAHLEAVQKGMALDYPPVEPELVRAAAREVPAVLRDMENDTSPGATAPGPGQRIVRADALVRELGARGHGPTAAACAVQGLVRSGALLSEPRQNEVWGQGKSGEN